MKMKAKGLKNNWRTRFAREDVKLCFLFKIFSVVFDYICMERTWIRDSSYNIENGVWKGGGGGRAEILCVCSGTLKCRWGQLEGRLELRAWLHEPRLLALQRCRHPS